MPKNHLKLLEKSMNETNWTAKIPEKARCVFHYGDTEGVEKVKTLQWEAFLESQVRCSSYRYTATRSLMHAIF